MSEEAKIETELCKDTFDMWVAENFSMLNKDGNFTSEEVKLMIKSGWCASWAEGYTRGVRKMININKVQP